MKIYLAVKCPNKTTGSS